MNNCTKFAPLILPSLYNLFVTVDIRDDSNSLDFLKQFLCTAVHVIISFFLILSYFLFISTYSKTCYGSRLGDAKK